MSAPLLQLVMSGLALAFSVGAIATTLGALLARSLVSMTMFLAATAALAGGAMLALGAGDAALAWVLIGVGLAPVAFLAVMLLSVRTAKARRGLPVFALAAAFAAGAGVLWATADVGPGAPTLASNGGLAGWLTPLLFVAVAACVGLLGYGERGALQRPPSGDE